MRGVQPDRWSSLPRGSSNHDASLAALLVLTRSSKFEGTPDGLVRTCDLQLALKASQVTLRLRPSTEHAWGNPLTVQREPGVGALRRGLAVGAELMGTKRSPRPAIVAQGLSGGGRFGLTAPNDLAVVAVNQEGT